MIKISTKKFFIVILFTVFIISNIVTTTVSAEINAEKLAEILSQLSGENADTDTTSTGTTPEPTPTPEPEPTIPTEEPTPNEEPTQPVEEPIPTPEPEPTVPAPEPTPEPTQPVATTEPTKETEPMNSAPTLETSFEILKIEKGDRKITLTFKVLNETPDLNKFEVTYINYAGVRNKSVTFDKEQIKNSSGNYVWYIANLEHTKYTLTIAGLNASGEKIPGVLSNSLSADLSIGSTGKCIMPNISGLRVISKPDTSVLYWNKIPEAVSYNVYNKDANGNYNFIAETKTNHYNIYLTKGSVKYEEFSIKGVCSDKTESPKFVFSTRVKTGPSEIIIGILSLIIGYFIVKKRKQKLGKV